MKVAALAGGVGASKLLRGLVNVMGPRDLAVIGNTGDDLEMHGLSISPDLDIVMYTLAGVVEKKTGWGIKDDTFHTLERLAALGFDTNGTDGNIGPGTIKAITESMDTRGYRIVALHKLLKEPPDEAPLNG